MSQLSHVSLSHASLFHASLFPFRRERFLLPPPDEDGEEEDEGGGGGRIGGGGAGGGATSSNPKAEFWEGYRAAMDKKAPPFTRPIGSLESDNETDGWGDGASLDGDALLSDESDADAFGDVDEHLRGELGAGAISGLPGPLATAAAEAAAAASLRSAEEAALVLREESAQRAADDALLRDELSGGALQWFDRFGEWGGAMERAREGLTIQSDLLAMWKFKAAALRAKLSALPGADAAARKVHQRAVASSAVQPARGGEASRSAAVLRAALGASGASAMPEAAELAREIQRQTVERERLLADKARSAALLNQARGEMAEHATEVVTLKAQSATWASENRQQRADAKAAQAEAHAAHAAKEAADASASALQSRVRQLESEAQLKGNLAAMWWRKAEGGVDGVPGGIDSRDASALGWQVESERAVSESRRWESLAKDGEAAADQRESELGQLKAQNQT